MVTLTVNPFDCPERPRGPDGCPPNLQCHGMWLEGRLKTEWLTWRVLNWWGPLGEERISLPPLLPPGASGDSGLMRCDRDSELINLWICETHSLIPSETDGPFSSFRRRSDLPQEVTLPSSGSVLTAPSCPPPSTPHPPANSIKGKNSRTCPWETGAQLRVLFLLCPAG